MSNFTREGMAAIFRDAYLSGGEHEKTATRLANTFTQLRVRESAFSERIIEPTTVTADQLQRRVQDTQLSKIIDLDIESQALQVSYTGTTNIVPVRQRRVELVMGLIQTDIAQIFEEELLSSQSPILQILEENFVKDIQEQQDRYFMNHVKSAVFLATLFQHDKLVQQGLLGAEPLGFADEDALMRYLYQRSSLAGAWAPIAESDLNEADALHSNIILSREERFGRVLVRDLANVPAARALAGKTLLMHQITFNDTLAWGLNEAGLKVTDQIVMDGYEYAKIGPYKIVTTVRENRDIVLPGQIWIFPDQAKLGQTLLLDGTHFYIDKRARRLEMQAWKHIGTVISNVRGVGVIVLRGGEVTVRATLGGTEGDVRIINDPEQLALPTFPV